MADIKFNGRWFSNDNAINAKDILSCSSLTYGHAYDNRCSATGSMDDQSRFVDSAVSIRRLKGRQLKTLYGVAAWVAHP